MRTSYRNSFLILIAFAASSGAAHASTITLSTGVSPNPYVIDASGSGESFTLLPTFTDWLLGYGNQKLGGGITTSATDIFSTGFYPNFTYTDGSSPSSATDENATFRYTNSGVPFTITIPVAAGGGRVILWLGVPSNSSATLTADLPDTAGIEYSTNYGNHNLEEWFLDYTSSSAQNMTITLDRGTNSNTGFFAVATTVPEPSSAALLLAGLAFCFQRRTRRAD